VPAALNLRWDRFTSVLIAPAPFSFHSIISRAGIGTFVNSPYLVRYLKDAHLELSNNRAKRRTEPFVIDRKNLLFSNTPGGAQGRIFSQIETATGNDLHPFRYLAFVLSKIPVLSTADAEWSKKLTPACAPESCRNL
jgi:hypothetical protein